MSISIDFWKVRIKWQEVYPCMASMLPCTSCACSLASIFKYEMKKLWFLIDSPIHQPMQVTCCICMWSGSAEACIPQDALHMWTTVWLQCSDHASLNVCLFVQPVLCIPGHWSIFNWHWPACITPYVTHVYNMCTYIFCVYLHIRILDSTHQLYKKQNYIFVLLCFV